MPKKTAQLILEIELPGFRSKLKIHWGFQIQLKKLHIYG